MIRGLSRRIFGTANERVVKAYTKQVDAVNKWETELSQVSDAELRQKTQTFKEKIVAGSTLEALLPEAFATVREAAKRTLGQRHYDMLL